MKLMAGRKHKLLTLLLGLVTLISMVTADSDQTSKSMNSTSASSTSSKKTSTSSKALPGLSTTTTQSILSSTSLGASISSTSSGTGNTSTVALTSSYIATFTPIVPNVSDDRYIYQAHHIGGTVFIAVGSCLGFILLVVTIVWAVFALSSWYSARKEYQLKEMESKYQYDPFYLSPGTDFNDTNSLNYSDGDENSDISEKVLKNKSSRLTLHTFGSGSVLNLLNQENKKTDISDNTNNKSANNNRKSMFISPTEVLQNEIINQSNIWHDSNANSCSLFESTGSTPKEQTHGQFINNPNLTNLASNAHWMSSVSPREYPQNDSLLLRPDFSNSPLVDSINDSPLNEDTSRRKKNYRPPSMHLEQLLDGNDDK